MRSSIKPHFSGGYFHFPSKHQGSLHWLIQRLTGSLLVILGVWFLMILKELPLEYAACLTYLSSLWHAIPLGLFILLMLWHGYLGMEVILDDYISNALWHSIAFFLLRLSIGWALAVLVWAFSKLLFQEIS